jgi:hypothetical protein
MQEKYELLAENRQSEQLEMTYVIDNGLGIATNLHVINENLTCLVKYLLLNYEDELL